MHIIDGMLSQFNRLCFPFEAKGVELASNCYMCTDTSKKAYQFGPHYDKHLDLFVIASLYTHALIEPHAQAPSKQHQCLQM